VRLLTLLSLPVATTLATFVYVSAHYRVPNFIVVAVIRCVRARRTHQAQAAAAGVSDTEHLAQGSDEQGRYSWTQTDDEVEVSSPALTTLSSLGQSRRTRRPMHLTHELDA